MIRRIVEESKAEIDVEDDGTILIYSPMAESLDKARSMIEEIIEEPEIGKTYLGKVVSIVDFGAFVQILPTVQGLLHISEIANYRVNQVTDELTLGEEIPVKVIDVDKATGKVRLSRRALLEGKNGAAGGGARSGRPGGAGGRPSGRNGVSGGRYRSRRSPQYGGSKQGGSRQDSSRNVRRRDGVKSGNRRGSNVDRGSEVRFPGNLGPDPRDPGGLRGGKGRGRR